jgi:hypothetical protein
MPRRRFASATVRRKRVWTDHETTQSAVAENTATAVDVLAGFVAAGGSTQGCTVVRALIDLTWTGTALAVSGDKCTIGLVTAPLTVGVYPDPIAEPYADWAYVRTLYKGAGHGLLTAGSPDVSHHDVRSKRKLDEVGSSLWLVTVLTAPGSVNTMNLLARVRCLLLLP